MEKKQEIEIISDGVYEIKKINIDNTNIELLKNKNNSYALIIMVRYCEQGKKLFMLCLSSEEYKLLKEVFK